MAHAQPREVDAAAAMSREQTLALISERMEKVGDLPVFNATVNQICNLSSDPTSDAMQLSQQVLKDANLSARLLRLANSPYYARGTKRIEVVSRAVIVLGFDTVKNLCLTLKLIESFQSEHPAIDMERLLVQSFISAGFARDLALRGGVKDAEHTYTCALLHNLGEIAVAYFLPEHYLEIERLNQAGEAPALENERAVLGASICAIGKKLAASWDFSPKVVATMDNDIPPIRGPVTRASELDHLLASLGSRVVAALYSRHKAESVRFQEVMVDLSKAIGVGVRDVENALTNSFEQSCELARDYGLDRTRMMPVVEDTEEESRDKLALQFSYYVSNKLPQRGGKKARAQEKKAGGGVDAGRQLQFIQEITSLITETARLNTVLIRVLEGIHEAIGLPRVALCLLTPDRRRYGARIVIGTEGERIKRFFDRPVEVRRDLFSKVAMEGIDVVVERIDDPRWAPLIGPDYGQQTGGRSFIVSALRSGIKPLGFIYADTGSEGKPLSGEQHRGFQQFVAQARLALQACR